MSNMSYCRFQNTLTDLEDCLEVLANNGLDDLSDEEVKAAERLIKICTEISQDFDSEAWDD